MKRFILVVFALFAATAASAQTDGSYQVRAGDTLRIEVLEDPNLNRSALVLPDGRISFPFAGTVQAAGKTTGQIEATIASGIASNFAAEPNVYVSVVSIPKRAATGGTRSTKAAPIIRVYMMGEVNGPGKKELAPGTTLLQALAQSGGFTKFAATKRVQLRRRDAQTGTETIYRINYKALAEGAQMEGNAVLADGDVILVPERRLFE